MGLPRLDDGRFGFGGMWVLYCRGRKTQDRKKKQVKNKQKKQLCPRKAAGPTHVYSMYDQHFHQCMDRPGMVANPARVELNKRNEVSLVPVCA